ncbi:MAG: CTAG/PCC1 family protein [Nanoarchaeota archaeon]|nr:CTAG/PCC1 family protein [Nanoarchaeota archaeon]
MKYSAKIIVKGEPDNIIELFKPEIKEFQNKRASYELEKKGEQVEFNIKAQDSTALRSVINSITKNLTVYEKVSEAEKKN